MNLTVLVWNIWLDNQIEGKDSSSRLFSELKRIIELYQPDCIGLNEVLHNKVDSFPFVLDFLKDFGYKYSQHAIDLPLNEEWSIGSALVSRLKLNNPHNVRLCKDADSEKKGYHGHEAKGIRASIIMPDKEKVDVIIAHPLYLRPHTIREHYKGTASLKNILKDEPEGSNLIIAGDFNEPRFMPRSFKKTTSDILNFKSGSLFNATWRHNASFFTPIRANLDQVYWSKKGKLELVKFKVIKSKVSDHKPLVATFTIE